MEVLCLGRPPPCQRNVHSSGAQPRTRCACPTSITPTSVLQSLSSTASKRTYVFAINDFIAWYCSEPRLAFGRTVVLRYRYELEVTRLAPATINLRLAAVRRLPTRLPTMACSVRSCSKARRSLVPARQLAHLCSRAYASRSTQQDRNEGQKRPRHSGHPAGLRPAACGADQYEAGARCDPIRGQSDTPPVSAFGECQPACHRWLNLVLDC